MSSFWVGRGVYRGVQHDPFSVSSYPSDLDIHDDEIGPCRKCETKNPGVQVVVSSLSRLGLVPLPPSS